MHPKTPIQLAAAFGASLLCGLVIGRLATARSDPSEPIADKAGATPSGESIAGDAGEDKRETLRVSLPNVDAAERFEQLHTERSPLARIALAVWAEQDPEAALRRVGEIGHRFDEREPLLRVVLEAIATRDPEAMLEDEARLRRLGGCNDGIVAVCAFRALASRNPRSALRRAIERDAAAEVYSAIFEVWAMRDPAAVETAVRDERDLDVWRAALQQVAWAKFRDRPESARAWLADVPHRDAMDARSIEEDWNRADPAGAAERLRALLARRDASEDLGEKFWERKRSLFVAAHPAMPEDELLAVLASFDEPGYIAEDVLPAYPAEKRARLLVASGVHTHYSVGHIVHDTSIELAKRSPPDALAWAARLGDDGGGDETDTRADAVGQIVATFAARDPAAALAMVAGFDDDRAEDLIGSSASVPLFGHLSGLEFATEVEGFESERLKTFLRRHSLPWRIARESTADALAWVEGLPRAARSPEQGWALVYRLIEETGNDHATVLEWADAGLPEGTRSPALYRNVAESWERHDRTAAATWLGGLEDGPYRDAAIAGFIRNAARGEYGDAFEFAMSIADRPSRQSAVERIYSGWVAEDPVAAAAAFPDADLSGEARARIAHQLETTR